MRELLLLCLCCAATLAAQPQPYPGCAALRRGASEIRLGWAYDAQASPARVRVRVEVSGSAAQVSALAIAVSDPGHASGDVFLVLPLQGTVRDAHMLGMKVALDRSQDLTVHSVDPTEDGFVAEFSRVAAASDADDVTLGAGASYVSWAVWESPSGWTQRPADMGAFPGLILFSSEADSCGHAARQDNAAPDAMTGKGSLSSSLVSVNWELVSQTSMKFTITAQTTTTWFAFGLNPAAPAMKDADMYVAWVLGGNLTLIDAWASGYTGPVDDLTLGGALNTESSGFKQNASHTIVWFQRALATSDKYDHAITASPVFMLWAMGPENSAPTWTKGSAPSIGKHRAKGGQSVQLLDTPAATPSSSSAPAGDVPTGKGSYTSDMVKIFWEVASATRMKFTVTAPTVTTWFAFGLNPTAPAMSGADMYVSWVSGGNLTVLDSWATGHAMPVDDLTLGGSLNTEQQGYKQNGTHTTVWFQRPLAASDKFDHAITSAAVSMLWAIGAENAMPTWTKGSAPSYGYHRARGGASVQLLDAAPVASSSAAPVAMVSSSSPQPEPVPGDIPSGKGVFSSNLVRVEWEVASATRMRFTITAQTSTTWFAFGWNPTAPAMAGADMYVAWVLGGNLTLIDSYATGHAMPTDDLSLGGTLNTEQSGWKQNNSHTTVWFQRALVTSDKYDHPITSNPVSLLWAIGEENSAPHWTPGSAPSYGYHRARGGGGVQFLNSPAALSSSSPDPVPNPEAAASSADVPDVTPPSGGGSFSSELVRVDWSLLSQSVKFTVTAKTKTAWFAFGWNPTAVAMSDSDMYVAWASKGALTLIDSWATGHSQPKEDTSFGGKLNAESAGWKQNDTHTTVWFSRALETGDKYDHPVTTSVVNLVWAIGEENSAPAPWTPGSASPTYGYHRARGGGPVQFIFPVPTPEHQSSTPAEPAKGAGASVSLSLSVAVATLVACVW